MKQIQAHMKSGIIETIPCDKYENINGVYHFINSQTGYTHTLNVVDVERLESTIAPTNESNTNNKTLLLG